MDRAEQLEPAKAATEAVKAYLRANRARVVEDPELWALLLPERFGDTPNVSDFQRYVIDRLIAQVAALKIECEGRQSSSDRADQVREGGQRLVLDLIEARTLEESIVTAKSAAAAFDAVLVSLGLESDPALKLELPGICLLPPGCVNQLIEPDATVALLKGNAHSVLFPGTDFLQSVAVFRLGFGPKAPPALYAVGSRDPSRFDHESKTHEIAYFVRALERKLRVWLDDPKT